MSVTIRRPVQSDKAGWTDLWRRYLAFYETELPASQFQLQFERITAPEGRSVHGLVAEMNNQLVGLVHYLFHAHGWKPTATCYLQDLFVADTIRGQGVGRKLIEAVYEKADANGAASTYWLTQDFNHTARKLYDQVGTKTSFIVYRRP